MRLAALVIAIGACQPPTAPHESDHGPTIVDAREIVSPATLDTLRAVYADVSKCLGVPMDERKFDMARYFEADHIEGNLGGVRIGPYLYAVMGDHRPSFWAFMRHELVHYVSEKSHGEGFREECA